MEWFDFYQWLDGEEWYLGEGMLMWGYGRIGLEFQLPNVPEVDDPEYMPMSYAIAKDMLAQSVNGQRDGGKVRLPHFSYWIRWEPKASQTELGL